MKPYMGMIVIVTTDAGDAPAIVYDPGNGDTILATRLGLEAVGVEFHRRDGAFPAENPRP